MYGALRTQQANRNVWCGDHALCQWHLLVVGWPESVSKHVPDDATSEVYVKTAYEWIQSWFYAVESDDEFDHSLRIFWKWLDQTDDSREWCTTAKTTIRDFVFKSLLPKREYRSRSTRIDQLSLDAKTTSVVESQNSTIKQGSLRVAPNCSITKSTSMMLDQSNITSSLKKMRVAKQVVATPLWTQSSTRQSLTQFAEVIVSQKFENSLRQCSVQLSPVEWVVFPIDSLGKSLGIHTREHSPIPKFRRLRKVSLVNNSFLCCDCYFFIECYCRVVM
jgi:hypothetical protein